MGFEPKALLLRTHLPTMMPLAQSNDASRLLGHVIDDGGEAGGAVQGDRVPGLVVGVQNALSSTAQGAVCLHVEEELVRQVRVGWDPSAEPECREQLVRVVVLDDLTDGLDGHGVGVVTTGTAVVEGSGVGDLTVGGREVDADGELKLQKRLLEFHFCPNTLSLIFK